MAIKSILFNTEMVRAILDGRKSCTRKIIKPQPTAHYGSQCVIPPYKPGDILYVRETFIQAAAHTFWYKANDNSWISEVLDWKPSIHMPKEAARIWLKVTDVRVERLQECGEGWCIDIEKEGIVTPQNPILYISDDAFHEALRLEFQKVWDSTIKKSDRDRYGWEANPYVFVIEFSKVDKPEEVYTPKGDRE